MLAVRSSRPRSVVVVAALAVLVTSFVVDAIAPGARAHGDPGGLREVGMLQPVVWISPIQNPTPLLPQGNLAAKPPPMIVDPKNRLGFAVGYAPEITAYPVADGMTRGARYLVAYDLDTGRVVGYRSVYDIDPSGVESDAVYSWGVDSTHQQLLAVGSASSADSLCTSGNPLNVIDYSHVVDDRNDREITVEQKTLPCSGAQGFVAIADSLDDAHGKMYFVGKYASEKDARSLLNSVEAENNEGQSLILRQVDVVKLATDPTNALDWEIDLRNAGCGRMAIPFVARSANDVLTYCQDTQAGTIAVIVGQQGYVVRVPLDDHDMPKLLPVPGAPPDQVQPVPDPTNVGGTKMIANADVHRIPALSGDVHPLVDPESDRMLLVTNDAVNGDAVWVFNAAAERFDGVVTGGQSDEPAGKTAAGIDPTTGRTYMFTSDGMLVAQIRHRPFPPGAQFDVLTGADEVVEQPDIYALPPSPDGRPARLFLPIHLKGYAIVEDDTTEAVDPVPLDPDRNTDPTAVEGPGSAVTAGANATASGAHIVMIGGTQRAVNDADTE